MHTRLEYAAKFSFDKFILIKIRKKQIRDIYGRRYQTLLHSKTGKSILKMTIYLLYLEKSNQVIHLVIHMNLLKHLWINQITIHLVQCLDCLQCCSASMEILFCCCSLDCREGHMKKNSLFVCLFATGSKKHYISG
jgi:hypothetical protein